MMMLKNYLVYYRSKYLLLPIIGYFGYRMVKNYYSPTIMAPKIPPEVIRLIDASLDHKESIMDAFAPKMDAFDKPFEICERIRKVPPDMKIKLVLCTKGGSLFSCEKILRQLRKHPAGYTAYIRYESFSAGTILALGASEIVMGEDSYLGKIDPQFKNSNGAFPMIVYHNLEGKAKEQNIANVKICQQYLNYMRELLKLFPVSGEVRGRINDILIHGDGPHETAFDRDFCQQMGLNVRSPKPEEMHLLV